MEKCFLEGLVFIKQCPVLSSTGWEVYQLLSTPWVLSQVYRNDTQPPSSVENDSHIGSRSACLFHLFPGRDIPLGQNYHHSLGFVEGTGSRQVSTLKCHSCQVQGETNMALATTGKILAKTSTALLLGPPPPSPALLQLTFGSPYTALLSASHSCYISSPQDICTCYLL